MEEVRAVVVDRIDYMLARHPLIARVGLRRQVYQDSSAAAAGTNREWAGIDWVRRLCWPAVRCSATTSEHPLDL